MYQESWAIQILHAAANTTRKGGLGPCSMHQSPQGPVTEKLISHQPACKILNAKVHLASFAQIVSTGLLWDRTLKAGIGHLLYVPHLYPPLAFAGFTRSFHHTLEL